MELQHIQSRIFVIRDQKVMLDIDLAQLYSVETKYLKRAVKQNRFRFPEDFMFELTAAEWKNLRCNFSTSSHGGIRYLPYVFTEQGVAMLSSILKSRSAVEVNISIMRAFVLMRQFALSHAELTRKLKQIETRYNRKFSDVFEALRYLMADKKARDIVNRRKRIGFKQKTK